RDIGVYGRPRRLGIGLIEKDRVSQRQALEHARLPIRTDDLGPGLSEHFHHRAPDASTCPGDQYFFAIKAERRCLCHSALLTPLGFRHPHPTSPSQGGGVYPWLTRV